MNRKCTIIFAASLLTCAIWSGAAFSADGSKKAAASKQAAKTADDSKCGAGMAWIPPGEFSMGCSPGDNYCSIEEKPAKTVSITKGFCIDRREATQRDYKKIMGTNPSFMKDCGEDCPVESTYWFDAREYCARVGKRLPTEAEWEYAARGGAAARYFWGDEMDGDYAWYGGNSGPTTHPVGTKKPNAYGLYDMLGNVWEWTEDCYDRKWYERMPDTDPFNDSPQDCNRAVRGSSWLYFAKYIRVSARMGLKQKNECIPVGFRCAAD